MAFNYRQQTAYSQLECWLNEFHCPITSFFLFPTFVTH